MNITYISSHVFLIHLIFTFLSGGALAWNVPPFRQLTVPPMHLKKILYIIYTELVPKLTASVAQVSWVLVLRSLVQFTARGLEVAFLQLFFLYEFWFENFISTGYKPLQQNIESQKKMVPVESQNVIISDTQIYNTLLSTYAYTYICFPLKINLEKN